MYVRNRKAPKGLFNGLVFDGSLAGVYRGSTYYHDASGLGNNGTLTNMDPATDWVWSPELNRWALDFDGSNDYVRCANSASLQNATDDFSVSIWLKANASQGGFKGIIGRYESSPSDNRCWMLFRNGPSLIEFYGSNTGTSATKLLEATLPTAEWHHFAIVRRDTQFWMLMDKQVVDYEQNLVLGTLYNTSIDLLVGSYNVSTSNSFGGQTADPLIFNRSITTAEIQWLASPANHLRVPWRRTVFPSAVVPLVLPDYPDVENESPYEDDESIVTVAATGGSAPVSYSLTAQSTTVGMLKVTGTLNPDATGIYTENGTYNGEPAYERADGAYWIWWNGTMLWFLSTAKGDLVTYLWYRNTTVLGDYTAFANTTGTATVALYAPFAINSSTGEITIADASGLAVGQTWTLTVRATDALLDTDDGTVTVELVSAGPTFNPAWAARCNNLIGAGI